LVDTLPATRIESTNPSEAVVRAGKVQVMRVSLAAIADVQGAVVVVLGTLIVAVRGALMAEKPVPMIEMVVPATHAEVPVAFQTVGQPDKLVMT